MEVVKEILIALVLLAAPSARAGRPPHTTLTYSIEAGAERCPDEAALRAGVRGRLGYDPFVEQGSLKLWVRVRGDAAGLRAQIDLLDEETEASGARELRSPAGDCVELASSIELAVSLAIDPAHELGRAPPPPRPVVAPAPAEPERDRSLWVGLGVVGSLDSTARVGFTLEGGLRTGTWSLGLEGRGDVPGTDQFTPLLVGRSVSSWQLLFTVVPCFRIGEAIALTLCGLASGGALIGHSVGFETNPAGTFSVAQAQAGLRAGMEIALGRRFSVALRAEGRVSLLPDFRLIAEDRNHQVLATFVPARVSGAASAALVLHFR